jgi:uncharacterized iron-regulated membrane protein
MKRTLRFIHLWLGLISGLIVFVVAITGSIYAFEEEIRSVIHKDLFYVSTDDSRQPVEKIISTVKQENPFQKIKNIRIFSDPERSVQVNLRNNTSIYVDPYSGKTLGKIDTEKEFLAVILKIHRSLYLGDFGKKITGISAFIFLFMLISGMILWWPGSKRNLKKKFRISAGSPWKKLNYDLHSVLGFYASWIIIFTALTGLVWSYKWMESGLYTITGSAKENNSKMRSVVPDSMNKVSVDIFLDKALSLSGESAEQFILLPEDSIGFVKVNVKYEKEGFFTKHDQFYFDQYSGKLLKESPFSNSSAGDKLKATNYNIHTGKVLGLPGQFLVFFAALISASLPVTGFMFWWGKRNERKN